MTISIEQDIIRTMKNIKLTQGKYAIVDDEEFERLSEYKWCAVKNHKTFRVQRAGRKGESSNVFMHQDVIGKKKGFVIDHINRNPLDNRKINLRHARPGQNNVNSPCRVKGKAKGVWQSPSGRWVAQMKKNGKMFYFGIWDTKKEAIIAYNKGAKTLYGEFAWLNPT